MTKTMTAGDLQRLDVGDPCSFFSSRRGVASARFDGREANLVIVPRYAASDLKKFCEANAKACPVLAMTRAGETSMHGLESRDIRLNASSYDVHTDGALVDQTNDVRAYWQDDLVCFALGSAGMLDVALRRQNINPRLPWSNAQPRYRTRLRAVKVGPYAGDLIVSMRAIHARHLDQLLSICVRHPGAHGAPVHVGDPTELGIDLSNPDWGLPIQVGPGEVPVFFASSMTAHRAVADASLPLAIVRTSSWMVAAGVLGHEVDGIAA